MAISLVDIVNADKVDAALRPITKCCFITTLILLPILIFGDHKNMISITFQTIVMEEPPQYDVTYNLLIVFNILGLIAFYWLRNNRLRENMLQYENLKQEKTFADSEDYSDFVAETVCQINEVMQRRNDLFEATRVRSSWIPEMELNLPVTEDEAMTEEVEVTTASPSSTAIHDDVDNFDETQSTGMEMMTERDEFVQ